MAEVKYLKRELATLWDTGTTLVDGSRKAADYDVGGATPDEALFADFFLTISTDTTAATAGDIMGELYLLPSTDEGTERYPTGGDGTVGGDFDPQGILLVGTFEARDPGTDANTEVLVIGGVPLYQGKVRVVFKNTSGKTISLEWQMEAKVYTQAVV